MISSSTVRRTVRRTGRVVSLSAREFALLEYLALRRGASSRATRSGSTSTTSPPSDSSNVVDVYVGYLRRKLGDGEGGGARLIHTHRGLGYSLGPTDGP